MSSRHWGCDLTLNVDPDTHMRPDGTKVGLLGNGESGHLYINYIPPTADKPGALLIGIENASPDSPTHSILGTPAEKSAFGGSKWKKLDGTKPDIVTPKQFGGMTMKLDKDNLEEIVRVKASDYRSDLGSHVPARSMKEFKERANSKAHVVQTKSKTVEHHKVVASVKQKQKKQTVVVPTSKKTDSVIQL